MARLSAAKRRTLPTRDFAGPGRSYPVNDAAHARNAKARASEMRKKGRLSSAQEARIDRLADRKLKSTRKGTRKMGRTARRSRR